MPRIIAPSPLLCCASSRRTISFKRAQDAAGKVVLTVMYASMTGNTASYAEQVAAVLATHSAKGASLTVKLLNMEEFEVRRPAAACEMAAASHDVNNNMTCLCRLPHRHVQSVSRSVTHLRHASRQC